jgi:hypothetical protein
MHTGPFKEERGGGSSVVARLLRLGCSLRSKSKGRKDCLIQSPFSLLLRASFITTVLTYKSGGFNTRSKT